MPSTAQAAMAVILGFDENPEAKHCRAIYQALVGRKDIALAIAAKHHLAQLPNANVNACLRGVTQGVHKRAQELREEGRPKRARHLVRRLEKLKKY